MRHTSLALCFCLTASLAFGGLIDQPKFIPPAGDHGVYSVQDQALGAADPDRAIAYDNFSLAQPVELTGVDWSGIWAEPLPAALSAVNFIVEIWNDLSGVPDLDAGPVLQKVYENGNIIGPNGDLTVAGNSDISPNTPTTEGGGPGADYTGDLPGAGSTFMGTTSLAAGDYWISIIADQSFDNPVVVDPEWQWALGSGPMDGFFARDSTLDPPATPAHGLHQEDKDLSFKLRGNVVPEPSGLLLSFLGLLSAGMMRRRRK